MEETVINVLTTIIMVVIVLAVLALFGATIWWIISGII